MYKVVFVSELKAGVAQEEARARLQKVLKLSDDQVDKLISAKRHVIKKDVAQKQAVQYKLAIEQCGFQCQLLTNEAQAQQSPAPAKPQAPAPTQVDAPESPPASEPPAANPLPVLEPEPAPSGEKSAVTASETTQVADEPAAQKATFTATEPAQPAEPTPPMPEAENEIYNTPKAAVAKNVYCRECGAEMDESATTCPKCHAAVASGDAPSKIVAGFLAFFLGGFGAHRFYLHQWWGIFYIPLAFFGISGIVSFFEAIYFWAISKDKWNAKYGHQTPVSAVILVAILILPIVAIMGILAAIAIPAYQDYTLRAKVHAGLSVTSQYQQQISSYVAEENRIPNTNSDIGAQPLTDHPVLRSLEVTRGATLITTFKPLLQDGQAYTMTHTPDIEVKSGDYSIVEWSCKGGTLPDKFRPAPCRGGDRSAVSPPPTAAIRDVTPERKVWTKSGYASLILPEHWKTLSSDQSQSSLFAGNTIDEGFIELYEESEMMLKQAGIRSLDEYADAMLDYYQKQLKNAKLINSEAVENKAGEQGRRYELSATVDSRKLIYLITFYKSEQTFFQILTWCSDSSYEKNKTVLAKISTSMSHERR